MGHTPMRGQDGRDGRAYGPGAVAGKGGKGGPFGGGDGGDAYSGPYVQESRVEKWARRSVVFFGVLTVIQLCMLAWRLM